MKYVSKLLWVCGGISLGILGLHLCGHEAFAAEKTSNWRPTYDLIMRWVNFGIIVFILNRYAKTPLKNFLRSKKEDLAQEIDELEEKKEDANAKISETQKTIDASDVRLAELKVRIVQQGEREKLKIVESAQQQSRAMLEDANRRIDASILQARNTVKGELIDAAIDLAMERLPQEITAVDNEKFVSAYLTSTKAE
ncbi:MAG: ATP synthase F0 subunit B [Desulfobacteraceae bacterium]|nr:ATP synthase F0 subunit B [Desulfobacteraceae bacterium]